MVYECPQCKTALPPGSGVCPNCGLKFETPTPADATLPPPASGPALPPYSSAMSGGSGYGTASLPIVDMPVASSAGTGRNVIVAVVALCILLVVVAVFAVKMYVNQEANTTTSPVTAPPPATGRPPVTLPPRSTAISGPNQAPVTLAPGTGGGSQSAGTADSGALVGRWQTKSSDYYVFGGDGSGYHGNLTSGHRDPSFSWVLVNNQLILNGPKEEHLTFSNGPDANTIYLRSASGRYDAFSRVTSQ